MADRPKNVIYLVADSLRPDALGCYGNDSNITTTLDGLASEGALFEDVVSAAPWTIPSIKSHATGKYPHEIGLFDPDADEGTDVFEYFSEQGYETACFYDSERRTELFPRDVDTYEWSYDIESMLEFIGDHDDDEPFFLFNLYRGTHVPYTLKYSSGAWKRAKDEMMEKIQRGTDGDLREVKQRYARSVERFSEWYVAAVIDRLRREGLLENTAIIVTGDHGESWGDRFEEQSDVDLFDLHGTLLYEEALHVPLILYNCGLDGGERIGEMVRSVDILPTLAESLDLPVIRDDLDGTSLVGPISGEGSYPELAFSSTTTHDQFGGIGSDDTEGASTFTKFSVRRRDGWKFILNADTGVRELYDLESDPGEQQNLVEDEPDVVDDLEDALQEQFGTVITDVGTPNEVRSRLEDLGYL